MNLDKEKCEQLNISLTTIEKHQEKIKSVLLGGQETYIKIEDTCRLNNSGVIKYSDENLNDFFKQENQLNIAAFVPAAGASSRFIEPFGSLLEAITSKDRQLIYNRFIDLFNSDTSRGWYIFDEISSIVNEPQQIFSFKDEDLDRLKEVFTYPKALFPCNDRGLNFFQIKLLEHKIFSSIRNEIYVIPPKRSTQFQDSVLAGSSPMFLEQGQALSTIRFGADCEPLLDEENQYSLVPAGHGALAKLFPEALKKAPMTDAFFIRNSDNISGDDDKVIHATKRFFEFYGAVFARMKNIRKSLNQGNLKNAHNYALEIVRFCNFEDVDDPIEALTCLQRSLFHTPSSLLDIKNLEDLATLYNRPLNILGVVPNGGKDVGGTPVFAKINDQLIKVCIEVPHASPADKKKYLEDSNYATHFNPVFVLSEAIDDISNYENHNLPFWLMAKKRWNGKDVYYFETILYEILGNSFTSNLIFTEIPRILFNPNKTLDDCVKNSNLVNHMK